MLVLQELELYQDDVLLSQIAAYRFRLPAEEGGVALAYLDAASGAEKMKEMLQKNLQDVRRSLETYRATRKLDAEKAQNVSDPSAPVG